ncbi:MAG: 2-oxoglutarate dehydrogenase E1 component [Buchnera aphidicola (Nurudea yanoniella)]
MKKDEFKGKLQYPFLINANVHYLENIYKKFLNNPQSIEKSWRAFFLEFVKKLDLEVPIKKNNKENFYIEENIRHIAYTIINTFRKYGHKFSNLDPLNLNKKKFFPPLNNFLKKGCFNISRIKFSIKLSKFSYNTITLKQLYSTLYKIYCNSIGYEYMHIDCENEKIWIQNYIERDFKKHIFVDKEKKNLLKNLISAETLEKYFSIKFPGSKRFSLEGSESLIPMLHEIINYVYQFNVNRIILGMAHRGRLNVLTNVLNKPIKEIFNEFSDMDITKYLKNGDVKYHMGFKERKTTACGSINLDLKFNPSHLEIVNPVVLGSARAYQDITNTNSVLALILHGDASISGQGVVQETLNMSRVNGYTVYGSLHIVINNQIGFTTSDTKDLRSSRYCTDVAKMISSPIFHVNADDPEATLFVVRLALDYKNRFKKDVFIDLVCYRRHGHNEIDDPFITQPIMYSKIENHPTLCNIYNLQLINKNVINQNYLNINIKKYKKKLDDQYLEFVQKKCIPKKNRFLKNATFSKICIKNDQHISEISLKNLAKKINVIPSNISMHDRVFKIYNERLKMADGYKHLDWGAAEILAYASLLNQGISCRLSGEDVGRGTFSHRHAVIYDQKNGSTYIPLQNIHPSQGKFYIWNSVLSEEAVLAFEYGYSVSQKNTLTIWEAQFGDFANGAQVVIDQFICSGEQKWGIKCNLIMLLPHGYEGQGPEHSSSRIERYLQLSSEKNIQICMPTTSLQMYLLLRRQALNIRKKPLIIMTPKSLLRYSLSFSSLKEFSNNTFQKVINEIDSTNLKVVKRIILCSGKIYYDLLNQKRENQQSNIAIIRIEQLYPFPENILLKILKLYVHSTDIIWCQEEPANQGAWIYIQNHLIQILPKKFSLSYVGRRASSSTATGYINIHKKQQSKLIYEALNIN